MIKKSELAEAVAIATTAYDYSLVMCYAKRLNKGELLEGTMALPSGVTVECSGTSAGSYSVNPADGHVTIRYPSPDAHRIHPIKVSLSEWAANLTKEDIERAQFKPAPTNSITEWERLRTELDATSDKLKDTAECLRQARHANTLKDEQISNLTQMRDGYKARVDEVEKLLVILTDSNGVIGRKLNEEQAQHQRTTDQLHATQRNAHEWQGMAHIRADAIDEQAARIKELEAQLAEKPKVELTVTGAGEVRVNGTVAATGETKPKQIIEYMTAGEFVATEHTDVALSGYWHKVTRSHRDALHNMISFYGPEGCYLSQRSGSQRIKVRHNDGKPQLNEITIAAEDYDVSLHSHIKLRSGEWYSISAAHQHKQTGEISFYSLKGACVANRKPMAFIEVKIRG